MEVRPLSARALKSAIDTLRPELAGASVLDLFAGQGRFGISALDEGANRIVFVESQSQTAKDIEKEVQHPSHPKDSDTKVVRLDVFRFIETTTEKFDIVFADPPFPLWNKDFESKLLTHVVKALTTPGIFLVKHPKGMVLSSAISDLKFWKTSVFGESGLSYFRYGP